MKNSSDTIGNRTRDLQACRAVPQSTAPPRAPYIYNLIFCIKVIKVTLNFHFSFHSRTVHFDIVEGYYSPTDAQVNCLKNNIEIDILMFVHRNTG